ncbi:MAG TPA: DUF2520 domain-containing protein [Solirubrobacteraceae bacterium]|nr:DUF2520 domain-containing protein [Solirubrobacteraceae bacterium]
MTSQASFRLPAQARTPGRVAVVGAGRMGTALAAALADAGVAVEGPLRRGESPSGAAAAVLLCVPDDEIETAASTLPARPGLLVGHTSAATALDALGPHEAFSLHPLMTITEHGARFAEATAAIAGATDRALEAAEAIALALAMAPVRIDDGDRVAYHAAACIASNFLVTIEDLAERLAQTCGLGREPLARLVRATVDNWARFGAGHALTGPIARGDEQTVARQREAVAERLPLELELFDALAAATRRLAAAPGSAARVPG